jgi:hypothetical protein
MRFTSDELVTLIESLREYRLRVADPSRQVLCDALIYRLGQHLVQQEKHDFLRGDQG